MRMIHRLSIFALIGIFASPLHALSLKDKLKKAEEGDFVVIEQMQTVSLLRVHSLDADLLTLEEITCPPKLSIKGTDNWAKWIKEGAPNHTSWMLIEIDLNEKEVLECFSFTRNAWLLFNKEDSFLLNLVELPLQSVPSHKRRRIGPPPQEGADMRKLWSPLLIFNGEKRASPSFDVYQVVWPSDHSPLSNKRVELYFDNNQKQFPFPYWAQVTDDSEAAFKLRVIDSGKGLLTSKKELPRRPITLTKAIVWNANGIEVEVMCPKYYKELSLCVIDHSLNEKTVTPLPFMQRQEGEKKIITVSEETLKNLLAKEHTYSLSLLSKEGPSVESKDFVYQGE